MKSNIEKVYSKLPQKKHNFKKQKVNLSLVDDINKAKEASFDTLESIGTLVTYADKITDDYKNIKERIDLVLPELDGQLNEANDIFEKSAIILSKAQNAAEELGISISNIDGYTVLEETLNTLARYIDSVINAKREIDNI
tara:strand:+ start:333 stop:752 length:420 start_codon:yes stop_codon:yes gene_type:complete